jgi:CheY-like chemotaxis protein
VDESATAAETRIAAARRGAGETVLAVEDNPRLRRVVMRQLLDLGYRPVEADGPAAAPAILEREKIDLLFTDVVMPGPLDGIELAKLAFERWPQIKVVLTSGFPGTILDDQLGPSGVAVRLVSKPYRAETLAGVLREVLDG